MRRRKAHKFTVRRNLRRVQDLNLHLSKPDLLDALCDLEAMGVWELLRTSRSGRPAEEVAGLANLSLTRTRLILEQLTTLSLVESRPAGRGRRLTTYRVTVPELRISHDGMASELIGKLLARWSESRAEYFARALKDGISPDGPAASGFCGSGVERLTSEETARLKSLIHQIGVLLRTAARRDPPPPRLTDRSEVGRGPLRGAHSHAEAADHAASIASDLVRARLRGHQGWCEAHRPRHAGSA